MRFVRQVLIFCALIGTLGATAPLVAAASKPMLAPNEAAKDLILKGDAKCTGCHDEADEPTGAGTMLELNPGVLAIGKTKHGVRADSRTPTCTDCHGESEKHRTHKGSDKPPKVDRSFRAKTTTPADVRDAACMSCHKGGNRIQWAGSQHPANDVSCDSCHQVHNKKDKVRDKLTQSEVCFTCHKEQRAENFKTSRHPVKEGKVACSDCHNLHGSSAPKLLAKNTLNDTCYTCHTEKRGPFLWEHPAATDSCANCHLPHGSNNPALLKARQPYLCEQCHDFTRHPGNVYSGRNLPASQGGNAANGAGNSGGQQMLLRGCANCHTQVHGTNHPSGPRFTR